ncbi:MAG: hypothetical protein LBQ91_00660 [Oscillospiraceae bacterium]|jgi:hypothetical protein|nr:hypothetical protein [Oscillospiraceae bacterium]
MYDQEKNKFGIGVATLAALLVVATLVFALLPKGNATASLPDNAVVIEPGLEINNEPETLKAPGETDAGQSAGETTPVVSDNPEGDVAVSRVTMKDYIICDVVIPYSDSFSVTRQGSGYEFVYLQKDGAYMEVNYRKSQSFDEVASQFFLPYLPGADAPSEPVSMPFGAADNNLSAQYSTASDGSSTAEAWIWSVTEAYGAQPSFISIVIVYPTADAKTKDILRYYAGGILADI